jgi:hypothetical protein
MVSGSTPSLPDEEDPFEIDTEAAHLFKHPHLGIDDIWASDPLFYPAKPPAHWLMCAEAGIASACRPVQEGPQMNTPMEQARRAADAVDRSLSSWIWQAVEHELHRTA